MTRSLARAASILRGMSTFEAASQAFDDAELARLTTLLGEPPWAERAMTADALQGMLVALAMGPDAAPPSDWMQAALGAEPDAPLHAPPELSTLLARFQDDLQRRVREGTLTLLLYSLRRGRPDYATWCGGFLAGVELSEMGWYDAADAEEVDELLFPIYVLADDLDDAERASYAPAAWRKLVLDSEAGLDDTLRRLHDYWTIVRTPPQTVRHAAPKVGRNDPCPCGSGRKHKHCCGR
jgi:uncharacterized protein